MGSNVNESMNNNKICISAVCKDETGKIWLCREDINGLYSYDVENNQIVFETVIEKEQMFANYLYTDIVSYDGKLFLIPYLAKSICAIDTKNGNKEYLSIDSLGTSSGEWWLNVFRIGSDKLALIPSKNMQKYVVLDMNTFSLEMIEIDSSIVPIADGALLIGRGICKDDDDIFLAIGDTNQYVRINARNGKLFLCKLNELEKISDIFVDHKVAYFNIDGGVKLIQHKNQEFNQIFVNDKSKIRNGYRVCIDESKIIFIPLGNEPIRIMNLMNENVYQFSIESCGICKSVEASFMTAICEKNKVYFLPFDAQKCLVCDLDNNSSDAIELIETLEDKKKRYEIYHKMDQHILVNECAISLKDFIEYMV